MRYNYRFSVWLKSIQMNTSMLDFIHSNVSVKRSGKMPICVFCFHQAEHFDWPPPHKKQEMKNTNQSKIWGKFSIFKFENHFILDPKWFYSTDIKCLENLKWRKNKLIDRIVEQQIYNISICIFSHCVVLVYVFLMSQLLA